MSAQSRRTTAALTFVVAALLSAMMGAHCAPREAPPEDAPKTASHIAALGWGPAAPPIRIRVGHTSTLLGTGEILVAGGGATPRSTELIDPLAGRVSIGPSLIDERTNHTATMLLSGKVLLAGGNEKSTAELYDPLTRTTRPTGSMAKVRRGHVAIRLRSGKVLVMGGGGEFPYSPDTTNEIYDPTTGTWSPLPDRQSRFVRSAATLANGKVLVSSGRVEGVAPTTEIYDATADSVAAWTTVPSELPSGIGARSLTRLFDGRVVAASTEACATAGGPVSCTTFSAIFSPGGAGTTTAGPDFAFGRDDFSAVRAIDGRVLFVGGRPLETLRRVEVFDPASPGSLGQDGDLSVSHAGTATLLPGGDVVVVGGEQASVDRRIAVGDWVSVTGLALSKPRELHSAVRLHDGRVLLTGGDDRSFAPSGIVGNEAEVIDPVAGSATVLPTMTAIRLEHTMTALRSGKILVAGGRTAAAELFDPTGAMPSAPFTALAPMSVSRAGHTATLLPSGKVLIIGGDAEGTAELFDPSSATFTVLPRPVEKRAGHGAVLMPNGLVLVVGGGSAEIFDPVTTTFRATNPPGASRDGRTAHVLASGKVVVFGGTALAADIFDPQTESWSFSVALSSSHAETKWTSLPDGRFVSSGGRFPIIGVPVVSYVFDPLAQPAGGLVQTPKAAGGLHMHTATLAGTGEPIVAGGDGCYGNCVPFATDAIRVYRDGAPLGQRPRIIDVPTQVVGGARVTITGTGFANAAEASDGRRSSSAVNHPVVHWVSDAGDAVIGGTILDFTDTTATWLVPATALYGHGQLFVSVSGILSRGRPVEIAPAQDATPCSYDAQCNTGFCVDGVCCDRRCDASCEGCSARRKTSGADGVCGPVPPGRDIAGRCVLKLGDACTTREECGPNFCSPQGVCCDSACEGQCLACDLEGKAGRCSAINEGACGAACDGDHILKQVGVPDVDCAPYKCSGPQCNTTCASVRECVAPAVCSLEGQCVPPSSPSPSDDAVCGCRAVGARDRSKQGVAGALLAMLFAAGLLRRRSAR
jgi:large repetitive protein